MGRKKSSDVVEKKANPKRDAVAKAIEALGPKAEIAQYAEYMRDNLNVEMENKVIGIHRHHIVNAAKKQKRAAKAGAPKPAKAGGDISFDDILAVKNLVTRHGAKRVHDVIDLLS